MLHVASPEVLKKSGNFLFTFLHGNTAGTFHRVQVSEVSSTDGKQIKTNAPFQSEIQTSVDLAGKVSIETASWWFKW